MGESTGTGRGGDFDDLVSRYRRELHVHCYRMLGSFDEAEDHVQEVLLRAWRSRDGFEGRSSPRTWLYRVATNACLDTLRRDARRAPARPRAGAGRPALDGDTGPSVAAMPWLQPYPDSLLDELADGQPGPEAVAVSRETVSLAFLAAIQLLPPRQRAVLILRDVAELARRRGRRAARHERPAVNSALQRARTDAARAVAGRAAGLGAGRRTRRRAAPPAPALHRRPRASRPGGADRHPARRRAAGHLPPGRGVEWPSRRWATRCAAA